MANQIILMADVIGSGAKQQAPLAKALKSLVDDINHACSQDILSPLTVTLGDEFQGLSQSIPAAVRTVLRIERELLRRRRPFRLRYVIFEGGVDTAINRDTAYGMLGDGLTKARAVLNNKSVARRFVDVRVKNSEQGALLTHLFTIFSTFGDGYGERKHPEILDMLLFEKLSDSEIAERTKPSRSQIWKFRNTWRVATYAAVLAIFEEELYR